MRTWKIPLTLVVCLYVLPTGAALAQENTLEDEL